MNRATLFFLRGLRDGLPIGLGYLAVSFAFGIQACQLLGSVFQSFSISATNLTSAGQFAGLDVFRGMVTGTATLASSLVAMALTQGIINLRYCLMSCALSQKLAPSVSLWQRAIISFGVTDEIFAMSMAYKGNVQAPYSYGMMAISITGWSTGTALGAWAGQILPESCVTALGMALYAMFVAIVLPTTAEDRNVRVIVIIAALSSVVMTYVPYINFLSSSWRVIFLTILLSAIAAICFPLPEAPVNEKRGARHD